jgi:NADPH:quinone reductase-like Zn-dependent oxidoreductase
VKAIIRDTYGTPQDLRFDDIPKPVAGPGEVLVAVRKSSLNTADLDQIFGRPLIARLGTGLRRPRSGWLGLDLAGVVEDVGEGVTRFRKGDRVWADMFSSGRGAFAEYACARETAFVPMPDGLDFAQAATIPHSCLLALQGLDVRGGVKAGSRVLINGAGGCVGPFAIQIAKSRGAHVTGVDHGSKLDMVESVGADEVIDYTRTDFASRSHGFDYILDIAARRSLVAHRRALAGGGIYVRVARDLGGFFRAAIFGGLMTATSSKRLGVFGWQPNRASDLARAADMIVAGSLSPLIDRVVPLGAVPEALAYLADGRARGKVLVDVSD